MNAYRVVTRTLYVSLGCIAAGLACLMARYAHLYLILMGIAVFLLLPASALLAWTEWGPDR